MVANTVCTTDCSSAKSSTTVWSATCSTGLAGTAVIATTGEPVASMARTTSVVVPEREIATTRS